MRTLAQMARVIGLLVCGLAVLFYSSSVLFTLLAMGGGGGDTAPDRMAGRLLGALAVDLLFIIVGVRLWRGIRRHR
jgi:hypothetical protein